MLAAAGAGRHDEVRTSSEGALGLAFVIPDDLAQQVFGVSSEGTAGDAADAQGGSGTSGEAPADGAASAPGVGASGQAARGQHAGRAGVRRARGR